MKFLFVHQNFPGQYLYILKHLVASGKHEVMFISQPSPSTMAGVRRAIYEAPVPGTGAMHPNGADYDMMLKRADKVLGIARNLKSLGFVPDIIIGHHGWGETLHLVDVWPGVPLLGYFEFFYNRDGQDIGFDAEFPTQPEIGAHIRAMNTINLLAYSLKQHGQTPTRWQHSRYPEWFQPDIEILTEGVNLDTCKPDPAVRSKTLTVGKFKVTPKDRLVTYVARNLEPYRGVHTMLRALPKLMRTRPDVKVIMIGGDDVSYGPRHADMSWREYFQRDLAGKYDASRVLMPGQVAYDQYLKILQRSDAHVYLTYPFVTSWSLRESMGIGCAIIATDIPAVSEFVTHNKTGILSPKLDSDMLAENILLLLEDTKLNARLRLAARRYAEKHLDNKLHIAAFTKRIHQLTGQLP